MQNFMENQIVLNHCIAKKFIIYFKIYSSNIRETKRIFKLDMCLVSNLYFISCVIYVFKNILQIFI